MIIDNLRREMNQGHVRVVGRVTWENAPRPTQEIYFDTDPLFADGLICNPDAFLVAGILPAWRNGERRILVDGEVSPGLFEGLVTVMSWLRVWFRPSSDLIKIEATPARKTLQPSTPERSGFFFSGGVDSLAALRANRLHFPEEHPGFIKDGLLIFGLEVDQPKAFEHALQAARDLAEDSGVTLVPVYTNVRYLDEDWAFYRDEFQGAILAAVGHAFAGRLTALSIAATYDIPNLGPWGSHPLLDPYFGTENLRIHHQGVAFSRLEKLKLLLDWPLALDRLRVCNHGQLYSAERLNCGRCEKCIRTMLELVALGALERSRAFPRQRVSEEEVAEAYIHDDYVASCYTELVAPLQEQGRYDLVRAIHGIVARYRGEVGWKGPIKAFDRKYLQGSLSQLKKKFGKEGRWKQGVRIATSHGAFAGLEYFDWIEAWVGSFLSVLA